MDIPPLTFMLTVFASSLKLLSTVFVSLIYPETISPGLYPFTSLSYSIQILYSDSFSLFIYKINTNKHLLILKIFINTLQCIAMISIDDVQDLTEAKMLLDMKNDEISSLQNSLKMTEIKTNKAIAEANYKISTQKNKVESAKKQLERHKEDALKAKQQIEKLSQSNKTNQTKNQQTIKQHQQKLKIQKQNSKNMHNQIRENQIILQETKQEVLNVKKELKLYKKIVNIPKILQITGQQVADDIPSYVDLMNILKDKSIQLQNLQEQISKVTQETIGEISVRERKISRFQKELRQLHEQNSTLNSQLSTVVEVMQQKQQQLLSQKQILHREKYDRQQTVQQLNEQLLSLRSSIKYYEKESIRQSSREEETLKFLLELTDQFNIKQKQYQKEIEDITTLFETYRREHEIKEQQFVSKMNELRAKDAQQTQQIAELKEQIKSKQSMLTSIQNQTSIFQKHMEQMSLQIDRWRTQAEETLKSKHQLRASFKSKQDRHLERESDLLAEIEQLRRSTSELREIKIQQQENRYRNLTSQLAEDIDWQEVCREDAVTYNAFLKKLYSLLSN